MTTGDLTRPIVGIENRTAAEVFGIMCDRIRHAHARESGAQEPVAWQWEVFEGGVWETCHATGKPDLERWRCPTRNLRPLYGHPAPAQEPVAVPAGWKLVPMDALEGLIAEMSRPRPDYLRCANYAGEMLATPVSPPAESGDDDVLEALKDVLDLLRKEAPGTPLNNHRFDHIGIRAHDAVRNAEARRAKAALASTPSPQPGGKHTMTLTLTDEQMRVLDELAKKQDLAPPLIFREALKLYQLADRDPDCLSRMFPAAPLPGAGVTDAVPAAQVINNNQPGNTAIIEVLCSPPTLEVGTELYRHPARFSPPAPAAEDAFRRGAEAMRELAAQEAIHWTTTEQLIHGDGGAATAIRALPLPTDKEG